MPPAVSTVSFFASLIAQVMSLYSQDTDTTLSATEGTEGEQ
jgi:hypothetical protein